MKNTEKEYDQKATRISERNLLKSYILGAEL
jgi:hypothetical protein